MNSLRAALVITAAVVFLPVTAQQLTNEASPKLLGRLVDVGGHRLHFNCAGTGKPTVIMEAGAGDFSFDWALVQPEVARFARVCAYDRAGYAWSDPGPQPRTIQQIVYELHTGLAKSEINPPYVLVGHSLGGLIVRVFADQYASDVAGMVLVDSSHEDQAILIVDRATKKERVVHWRELASGKTIPPVQTSMPALTSPNTGQTSRLPGNGSKLESPYDKLPSQVQELRRWATSRSSYQQARGSETFDFLADELARIYAARTGRKSPLEDKPLIVLTRGVAGEDETSNRQLLEDHDRLQLDLLSLSTNSKQIIAKASGHWIQLDQPQLVTEAIKEVVYAVRHRSRLSK